MSARFDQQDTFIRWNEEMARKYDPEAYHLRSNFLIRWIERRRVKTILRFLATRAGDFVLEVGCGAGNVLEQIPSKHRYGLDLSVFLLTKAHRRLADHNAGLAQANGEFLPFVDGKLDKLVCTEVLEHVENPRHVLQEMARVATDGATLVISVPNEAWIDRVKSILRATGLSRWLLQGNQKHEDGYQSPEKMTDEWHLHSFDLTLIRQVTANLLKIEAVQAVPFDFLPLRYVVKCSPLRER